MSKKLLPLHPAWAIVHRKPGTELKKIKDKYYLYGVSSIYDKATKKTKKVSLGIIGRISEKEGLIQSDKSQLKARLEGAAPVIRKGVDKEYGFSFYLNWRIQA